MKAALLAYDGRFWLVDLNYVWWLLSFYGLYVKYLLMLR